MLTPKLSALSVGSSALLAAHFRRPTPLPGSSHRFAARQRLVVMRVAVALADHAQHADVEHEEAQQLRRQARPPPERALVGSGALRMSESASRFGGGVGIIGWLLGIERWVLAARSTRG